LAAVAVISARAGGRPGRAAACSSLRYAVAVAVSMPTLTPAITRPMIRPGTVGQARKATPASMLIATAISAMRRRPSQSDRWPTRNRLATTPAAYAAKITVTSSAPKWSRAWYSTYSGAGIVENAIVAANA
jgi:hypothetical protein